MVSCRASDLNGMHKSLAQDKYDDFKSRQSHLRLNVKERLKHLLQVYLDNCAGHSETTAKDLRESKTTSQLLRPATMQPPDL